ncbi:hypothetical protein D1007_59629 [Hordeum vulgare]|nr:hypothetical protein D1007_59629 [Hordeum vulgare]
MITGGISLWRLILRDYGEVDGGANLQPALNVLYSLALFQGVLFCYRFFSYSAGDGYLSGARILDTLLAQSELTEQHSMIAQLIGSASCSQIVENLLQALDSRSRQDKEIMELAARILVKLAGEIHLKKFPQVIPCISSLLETSQRQPDDDSAPSGEFKLLMKQGLLILDSLAADKT